MAAVRAVSMFARTLRISERASWTEEEGTVPLMGASVELVFPVEMLGEAVWKTLREDDYLT